MKLIKFYFIFIASQFFFLNFIKSLQLKSLITPNFDTINFIPLEIESPEK
jgi:hypothetical protein